MIQDTIGFRPRCGHFGGGRRRQLAQRLAIEEDPTKCERPKFYLGDAKDTPPEKSIWVVEIPRPYNKLEKERLPKEEIAAWPFADYVFGCDWDVMSNVTKSRRYGFHDVVDSEEMFVRLLRRFRAERIVP